MGWYDISTAFSGEVGNSGPCDREDSRVPDELELTVLPGNDQVGSRIP